MNNMDQVLFRRRNKITIPNPYEFASDPYVYDGKPFKTKSSLVSTIVKNIETGYGYLLSTEIIEDLLHCEEKQIEEFYYGLLNTIKTVLPDKIYSPMYKNFPSQVMNMDESELYYNAIMHYTGNLIKCLVLPVYDEEERKPLFENTNVVMIEKGTSKDYCDCISNLFRSSTSLSQTDKEDIKDFIEGSSSNSIDFMLPAKFNHKEVMISCLSLLIEQNHSIDCSVYIKTATDVLRLAVGMSGGDISLSEKPKFRNFKRRERRFILNLINQICDDGNVNDVITEMAAHKSMWIRLGEKIHPGDYEKRYHQAMMCFNELRNYKTTTVNSVVRGYIESLKCVTEIEDLESLLEAFTTKYTGYFARSLDEILCNAHQYGYANIILKYFKGCVDNISTNVLLQMMTHFTHRDEHYRVFLPKGNITKAWAQENNLSAINPNIMFSVVDIIEKALIDRFKQQDSLGTVYLDKRLKDYTIPFSQRSASKSLKTISRGSRLPIDDDKNLRLFIYWKNGDERTDLDISCTFLTEDFKYVDHVSYTNLKTDFAVHSGDITDAPEGASEFLDLDINNAIEKGVRYCVASVFSYTLQPYCDLPECFVGWMQRGDLDAGEIYEPKTVENIFDLASNTQSALPVIIDLHTKEIIWCDFAMGNNNINAGLMHSPAAQYGINTGGNNVESNIKGILATCMAGIYMKKPTVYDVLSLHAEARAEKVYSDMKEAHEEFDTVFSVDNNTHTDLDTLMGQYLI